jgi:hypothetical protein
MQGLGISQKYFVGDRIGMVSKIYMRKQRLECAAVKWMNDLKPLVFCTFAIVLFQVTFAHWYIPI